MSRESLAAVVPSWLMLVLTEAVYQNLRNGWPGTKKPDETPPRKKSSDICRSLEPQKGQEPCTERAVRLGAIPTPTPIALLNRYWRCPNSRVCCVVGSDQSEML